MTRINKYLSQCGVASRRHADKLVTDGRITVNDAVIDTPGFKIDETKDKVCLDGQVITPAEKKIYIILNKPAGYVTSLTDPQGRKTVADLVADLGHRVYPIGRLDLDTEGTLLFTNDGELAHCLTHPKYGVKKIYRARVKGRMRRDKLVLFPKGIKLPDGNIGRAVVKLEKINDEDSIITLEMTEGRKREVKHLCKAVGHPVIKLVRDSFAGITCEGVALGQWRLLSAEEISDLHQQVKS